MHEDSDSINPELSKQAPQSEFADQIALSLEATEQDIRELAHSRHSFESDASLAQARKIVSAFRPVPQILWRLCSYAIGRPGHINNLTVGHVFGLKKLIVSIGRDPILGLGRSKVSTNEVVALVGSDIIAAASVIFAVSRRLQGMPLAKIWEPMFDEALLRANLGFCVGQMSEHFGIGRAMLAGFAGRIGMVVLLASGDESQAMRAVAALARRADLRETAHNVYGCDPAHVSAMVLSAAGCSRDAIVGVGAFGLPKKAQTGLDPHSTLWLSGLRIIEHVLRPSSYPIDEATWLSLGFDEVSERDELSSIARSLQRSGHAWSWLAHPDSD
jgi:hypothetical protein